MELSDNERAALKRLTAAGAVGVMDVTVIGPETDLTWRQLQLVRELADHGWRFAQITGDPVRYIVEAYAHEATPAEWNWLAEFYRTYPDVLDAGGRRSQADVYAHNRAEADALDAQAAQAVKDHDYDLARYLVDAAEWWEPKRADLWDSRRAIIARQETAHTQPAA